MADDAKDQSHRWILPLLVGIFCGGLGGSIFTWYMNRPKPTVLTYRIATTTLSAPEAAGLIPDLKVQIGGNVIQALYAHNIELLPRQGPFIDQADVAFGFPSPVRIYGIHLETPSNLHTLKCVGFATTSTTTQLPSPGQDVGSIQCALHPIAFQDRDTQPFRLSVATNRNEVPRVQAAAKGLVLLSEEQFSGNVREAGTSSQYLTIAGLGGFLAAFSAILAAYLSRREHFLIKQSSERDRVFEETLKRWIEFNSKKTT